MFIFVVEIICSIMITPSEFRKDIYNKLDLVISTGQPIEIKRKGKILKVIIEDDPGKLSNLKKRDIIKCNDNDLIYIDWLKEWKV